MDETIDSLVYNLDQGQHQGQYEADAAGTPPSPHELLFTPLQPPSFHTDRLDLVSTGPALTLSLSFASWLWTCFIFQPSPLRKRGLYITQFSHNKEKILPM